MVGDPLHQFVPIHLGHHYIAEDYVERFRRAKRDRVATVGRRPHSVTGILKRKGEKACYLRLVINDENSRGY